MFRQSRLPSGSTGCEYLMTPVVDGEYERLHFSHSENGQEVPHPPGGRYIPRALYENGEQWLLEKMWKTGKKKEALPGVRYDGASITYLMEDGCTACHRP